MTAVELAVSFAVGGSLLAVAVPAFVRNIHDLEAHRSDRRGERHRRGGDRIVRESA